MAAEAPREIANAHTVFNVINTFVFLGFVTSMASLVTRLIPERPAKILPEAEPQFLAETIIGTPSLALDSVQAELGHLGGLVEAMLRAIMPAVLGGSRSELERVAAMDVPVDSLHGSIVEYLRRVGSGALSSTQSERFTRLLGMANALENIGDVIETDLVGLGIRRIEGEVRVSGSTKALIEELHALSCTALHLAVQAAVGGDITLAEQVVAMKKEVSALAHKAAEHGAHRLTASEPNRLRSVTREMEVIERLRRIYYFAKKVAYAVEDDVRALVPEGKQGQEETPISAA
jgi:phosphate:Na+ symporter